MFDVFPQAFLRININLSDAGRGKLVTEKSGNLFQR